jgi:hypothetical protein
VGVHAAFSRLFDRIGTHLGVPQGNIDLHS